MLSNIASKDYENMKREDEDRNSWQRRDCHKPAGWQKTEKRIIVSHYDNPSI